MLPPLVDDPTLAGGPLPRLRPGRLKPRFTGKPLSAVGMRPEFRPWSKLPLYAPRG